MDKLQKIITSLEEALSSLKEMQSQNNPPQVKAAKVESSDFDEIKSMLDQWPEAVDPQLICQQHDDQDINERAQGIIELIVKESLKNKRFLDFGCGTGHVANVANQYGADVSVGYDLVDRNWKADGAILTTDFDIVKSQGPYDVILLFDVIDHAEDPENILGKCEEVLSDNGTIYMRCHPFTSRHATHLYHHFNKAYAHLVLSEEELKELCPEASQESNYGSNSPIYTYNNHIKKANLKIEKRSDTKEEIEDFFMRPVIAKRISKNTQRPNLPEFQMKLQWIDYVLKKP